MMRASLPRAGRGQVVGLLGGSFDPPHGGHVHITRAALRLFGLDRVWWLVSPGNPLKTNAPAPLAERLAAAERLMVDPRVTVTDIEARTGTRYTAETIEALMALYPGVRFVWLMGADNLAGFHRWERWRWIMETVPVGVLARPEERISARMSPAARIYREARLRGQRARLLGRAEAPAWAFQNLPMMKVSSSEIRAAGRWRGGGHTLP
ncbi:nicotinate-nucleotide adenylyltransferase [Aestuariibius sp. 2305UL40-4]|uniref:nicotinate-nucleotide adenylyltransferase n=1 Tax=Aestuariibius violaceus TaxID=3234132 RepID=UPI00345EFE49